MLLAVSARVRIPCGVPKKINPVVVEITGFSLFINALRCFARGRFLTLIVKI